MKTLKMCHKNVRRGLRLEIKSFQLSAKFSLKRFFERFSKPLNVVNEPHVRSSKTQRLFGVDRVLEINFRF